MTAVDGWADYDGRKTPRKKTRTYNVNDVLVSVIEEEATVARSKLRPALTVKQVVNGFIVYEGAKSTTPSEDGINVFADMEQLNIHIEEHFKEQPKKTKIKTDDRTMVID